MDAYEIDKRAMRRAFSRAAAHYDAAAVLQREVRKRMLEQLDYIRLQPLCVLDAGCGTGWGTRQLGDRYKQAEIIALDIAIGMLRTARGASSWWRSLFSGARQTCLCADIEALPLAAQSIDMAWSNLALQWCNSLPAAFREFHRVLRAEGLVMFSTFGPDTLKELRAAFSGVDGYSHTNRFIDMHDIGDMLLGAGFAEPVMQMEMITLTYSDVKAVMTDLRNIGAHNATAGRAPGMMGKSAWNKILENYERLRQDGKLPATFEVIYGHAWKAQSRNASDGSVIIQTPFKL